MTKEDLLKENERRHASIREEATRVPEPDSFEAWAAEYVKIKPKGGGAPVAFRLNRPQKKLVSVLEDMRRGGLPIRLILLKARQWGGSTCIQIYLSWLQIVHSKGLNSLIIAHQISGSEEIRDMFQRMVENYEGPEPLTLKRVGRSGATFRLAERDCKITVGTAERPDSSRGGDYNLVHLSEVGLWKHTKGKKPEDIVRSSTSGVLLRPMTMIALESTANGAGTYFHREYLAAKEGESQFRALFIPWYEIEAYQLPLDDPPGFADRLLQQKGDTVSTGRSQSGEYLWSLWERGATLEAIHWYIRERRKYADHGAMASEYPSDDIEAFVHSGERVFAPEAVDRLRHGVTSPALRGEWDGKFTPDSTGCLEVWKEPSDFPYLNRYLVVVDVGGRSSKADWSVIAVIDRVGEEGMPEIAAQWRGHIDHDLLADKAEGIARWYRNALLVIESNTLETHDRDRDVDGLQAPFILRQLEERYPNLYLRPGTGGSPRAGFHTNVSTKPMVIGTMVKYVREGLYRERDIKAIEEMIQYERKSNGSFGAYSGCHDDILMTRAIGLHIHHFEMEPPVDTARPGAGRTRGYPPGRPAQDAFGIF